MKKTALLASAFIFALAVSVPAQHPEKKETVKKECTTAKKEEQKELAKKQKPEKQTKVVKKVQKEEHAKK